MEGRQSDEPERIICSQAPARRTLSCRVGGRARANFANASLRRSPCIPPGRTLSLVGQKSRERPALGRRSPREATQRSTSSASPIT
jgi:hypothetical protein